MKKNSTDAYLQRMAERDPCISVRDRGGAIKPLPTAQCEFVHHVLRLCGYKPTQAVAVLRIGRTALYRILRRYRENA